MLFKSAFAAALMVAVSAPAIAALAIDEGRCVSVLDSAGCTFTGATSYTDTELENLYNATGKPGTVIDLDRLTKFEFDLMAWENSGSFVLPAGSEVTGSGSEWFSGSWTIPGYLIDYIGVKAATELTLFKFLSPSGSGSWQVGGSNAMSHIVFYGRKDGSVDPGGIPEPGTWAMLVAGFGLVGAVSRRRKAAPHVSA